MSENQEFDQEFHRDRRFHGGAPQHLDDDKLAEMTGGPGYYGM
jgi:hypothetical protein